MRWSPDELQSTELKVVNKYKSAPLMPDGDKNFGGSLVLDFRMMT